MLDALTGEPISPPLKCRGEVQSAQFSPDGRKVIVASGSEREGRQVRVCEMPEARESVDDLVAQGQMLSGMRMDSTGALVPIQPDVLLESWRAKRKIRTANAP